MVNFEPVQRIQQTRREYSPFDHIDYTSFKTWFILSSIIKIQNSICQILERLDPEQHVNIFLSKNLSEALHLHSK